MKPMSPYLAELLREKTSERRRSEADPKTGTTSTHKMTANDWADFYIRKVYADDGDSRREYGLFLAEELRDEQRYSMEEQEQAMVRYAEEVTDLQDKPYPTSEALKSLASAHKRPPRERPIHTTPQRGSASSVQEEASDPTGSDTYLRTSGNANSFEGFQPRQEAMLRAIEDADMASSEGSIFHRGTPAHDRYLRRYALIQEGWAMSAPGAEPLSKKEVSLLLSWEVDEGASQSLLDFMFQWANREHKRELKYPRGNFMTS